jgi:hypothetical protein
MYTHPSLPLGVSLHCVSTCHQCQSVVKALCALHSTTKPHTTPHSMTTQHPAGTRQRALEATCSPGSHLYFDGVVGAVAHTPDTHPPPLQGGSSARHHAPVRHDLATASHNNTPAQELRQAPSGQRHQRPASNSHLHLDGLVGAVAMPETPSPPPQQWFFLRLPCGYELRPEPCRQICNETQAVKQPSAS